MDTKIITFNVNGLRSIMTKDKDGTKLGKKACIENVLTKMLDEIQPDVLCLQEVRCNSDQDINCLNLENRGYQITIHCSTVKKGYSGTAIISKLVPVSQPIFGFDGYEDGEGRAITLEFDKFYVVNVYVPNSKQDLSRLDFRVNTWDTKLRNHIINLKERKPVILCGDMNVAVEDIDVHNPIGAKGSHGVTKQERSSFKKLLENMVDIYRVHHPNCTDYSWFSPFAQSRKYNKGWRIDYILVDPRIAPYVRETKILSDYFGSDHVPCFINFRSI